MRGAARISASGRRRQVLRWRDFQALASLFVIEGPVVRRAGNGFVGFVVPVAAEGVGLPEGVREQPRRRHLQLQFQDIGPGQPEPLDRARRCRCLWGRSRGHCHSALKSRSRGYPPPTVPRTSRRSIPPPAPAFRGPASRGAPSPFVGDGDPSGREQDLEAVVHRGVESEERRGVTEPGGIRREGAPVGSDVSKNWFNAAERGGMISGRMGAFANGKGGAMGLPSAPRKRSSSENSHSHQPPKSGSCAIDSHVMPGSPGLEAGRWLQPCSRPCDRRAPGSTAPPRVRRPGRCSSTSPSAA